MSGRRGRPPLCPGDVRERVVRMRMAGMGTPSIARVLNEQGIQTPLGRSRWTSMHVWRLLKTRASIELIDKLHGTA
ncbi:recombinase family protein [Streptosporangium sp. V21-05]|uniref:recombinase family protein n=1 Tax=Streptosporangium sp. V21-05 TaxID=3446115 RepID=UPI003F53B7F5